MTEERLSQSERTAIEGEIRRRIEELIRGCESPDAEAAFRPFSGSPEFLVMGADGSLCGRADYGKSNADYLRTRSAFRLRAKREEIRILGPSAAVFAGSYAAEADLRTGERDVFDGAGASFVFRKIDGRWEVVYCHESSAPPRRERRPPA